MSEKSKSTAFLLCYFLGLFGVHRFYIGRWPTGLLMLLTLGGLTFWWMIDAVLLAAGALSDGNGERLRTGPPDPERPNAGFWVRAAAWSVDALILNLGITVVAVGAGLLLPIMALGGAGAGDPQAMAAAAALMGSAVTAGVTLLAVPLYFGLQTASRHQATVGKRCFDLVVTTTDGAAVSLGRAVGRSLGYFLSGLLLGAGYLMVAFTRDKRALHDMLAGTLVIHAEAGTAPSAARAPAPATAPAALPETRPETRPQTRPEARAEALPGPPPGDRDPSTQPHTSSPAPAAVETVRRGSGMPAALLVVGALLLAGAAALALLS